MKHRRGFLEKSARSPSSECPLKYESASYFSTANYAINLDSCGEYSLRIWIKCFSFIPQFTIIKWAYLSFKNSIPPQLTSALWSCSAFGLWKKKKYRRFFNTSAQFKNAHSIHSAFYHCRMIDDNKKMFIPHLAIETELFHSAFVILVWCKTKGAVRAVCALLHIWPLST